MIVYAGNAVRVLHFGELAVPSFVPDHYTDADPQTLEAFGGEWQKFSKIDPRELQSAFDEYFDIIPEDFLGKNTEVLDIGCGSGRWSALLAEKVKFIHAVDPGPAVRVAAEQLKKYTNIKVAHAGFGCLPFEAGTFDFVLCLGVIQHVPYPEQAVEEMMRMLKPGGRILLYTYYNLAGRSFFYRFLFRISNGLNRMIFPLPEKPKLFLSDLLAVVAAGPFVLFAKTMRLFFPSAGWWKKLPFGYYAAKSWRIVRNDSLDRFGTPPVRRFGKEEISDMLERSGFREIRFSEQAPYWHVTAVK